MRRLALVFLVSVCACGLHASVISSSPVVSKPATSVSALVDSQQLRISAQRLYRKAVQDKAPLTASPADGKSFVNEFLGDDSPASHNDKQDQSAITDTARLPQ